jgi:FkbM family methyltransferase
VGVGEGTPDLYEAFPEPFLVLVEPLSEFVASIEAILKSRKGVHLAMGAGEREELRTIHVEPRLTNRSSLYARNAIELTHDPITAREVQITTLDAVLRIHHWQPPFGLKIDAEGAEMDIIRGATEFLLNTQFVIAEVSVLDRFPGSYSFAEFIHQMRLLGFDVCDILDIGRADNSEVSFLDLVFRRRSANLS